MFLWESKSFRDEPSDQIKNFESFKSKIRITGKTLASSNVKDVKISVSLKYLSNFWRNLEMPLINVKLISF